MRLSNRKGCHTDFFFSHPTRLPTWGDLAGRGWGGGGKSRFSMGTRNAGQNGNRPNFQEVGPTSTGCFFLEHKFSTQEFFPGAVRGGFGKKNL